MSRLEKQNTTFRTASACRSSSSGSPPPHVTYVRSRRLPAYQLADQREGKPREERASDADPIAVRDQVSRGREIEEGRRHPVLWRRS